MIIYIEAFSALGLFLFGMLYLEDSLKKATGASFKRWVKISTNTNPKALLTGSVATALLQSSSAVTLMTLSLIGAGIMNLQSGIGIIFGSNIGTTATGWIIALIGFKFDIKIIALFMVGFGGIGSVLAGEGKIRHTFGAIAGFGLIFLGIDGLKESFSTLSQTINIEQLQNHNIFVFLAVGIILTAIIQSSSASIAIAQSALFSGVLSFEHAAVFVIGANIGTTVTVLIGAIGGSADKKRTATAHVLFNLSTGSLALALLIPLSWVVTHTGLHESVEALALFHTLFNVIGVLIWYPIITPLSLWLMKHFETPRVTPTLYLHNVTLDIPALAQAALYKEVLHLGHEVCSFAVWAIKIPPSQGLKYHASISKILEAHEAPIDVPYTDLYHELQRLQGDILEYASALSSRIGLPNVRKEFDQTLLMAIQLIAASKYIKDLLGDITMLSESDTLEMAAFYHELRYQILALCMAYNDWLEGDEEAKERLEKLFNKLDASYKNSIEILNDMILNYKISKHMTAVFMNITHITRNFSKALYKSINMTESA